MKRHLLLAGMWAYGLILVAATVATVVMWRG